MLAREHLVGGLDDRICKLGSESPRGLVSGGCRSLDHHHRLDESGQRLHPGNREVLNRANGLDAVQRAVGNWLLSQRVLLGAETHREVLTPVKSGWILTAGQSSSPTRQRLSPSGRG